ncbi:hypothetical protein AGR7B_Cc140140 [Agrobacterium deltaense RV3]|nr:hypothetical protein AGR7B_Cc140140 [Agrobacterium deltaense RV3]
MGRDLLPDDRRNATACLGMAGSPPDPASQALVATLAALINEGCQHFEKYKYFVTTHVFGKLGLTMTCSHIRYSGNAVIGNHGNGNRRHEQGHGNDAEGLRPHHRPDILSPAGSSAGSPDLCLAGL